MSYELARTMPLTRTRARRGVIGKAAGVVPVMRPVFDSRTGLAGTATTAYARRGDLSGYDDGLGFSFNVKHLLQPKKLVSNIAKTVKKAAPIALPMIAAAIPVGFIASKILGASNAKKALDAAAKAKALSSQVKAAGLTLSKIEQPNGEVAVVAQNPATGAVVSSPLPISVDLVPVNLPTLPANAVQAAAPVPETGPPAWYVQAQAATAATKATATAQRAQAKATAAQAAALADAGNSVLAAQAQAAQAQAAQAAAVAQAANNANAAGGGGGGSSGGGGGGAPMYAPAQADMTGGGAPESFLQNPAVLIGAALVAFLAFRN